MAGPLVQLRPRGRVLVYQTLLWPDELRDPGDMAPSAPATDRELRLAEVLMRTLSNIEVKDVRDQYRQAVEQLVDAKVAGGAIEEIAPPHLAVDLLAALEASLEAARTDRGTRGEQ